MINKEKMQSNLNGWIIIDKPSGISSAHAVAKVKRLLKPKKIGHAGTLDPLASGVLPLALGEATKTVQYMMDAPKAYSFTVSWGQERTTDDAEGEVVKTSANLPSFSEIVAILPDFSGNIQQSPPAHSAIKLGGKRAYELARAGEEITIKPRQVFVKSLEVSGGDDASPAQTSFICHCGKGTYIRSLARDIGRELGCYGYISRLRRTQVGKFTEQSAISLENLENMVHKGNLNFLQSVESSLDDILAWEITSTQATDLRHGKIVMASELSGHGDGVLLLARHNSIAVAICELAAGMMKPLRVFNLGA